MRSLGGARGAAGAVSGALSPVGCRRGGRGRVYDVDSHEIDPQEIDPRRESIDAPGEGEGERHEILGRAYGQDAGFFDFYKSMQAYEASLGGDSTTMVLTPDSDFFRFFGQESID